jgi:adenine C2-methylase RlmN of 23S rRNA A2503 and tRNA A37
VVRQGEYCREVSRNSAREDQAVRFRAVFVNATPGAVRIPLLPRPGDEKYIVCVSSQVGCAMACAFCATGKFGFQRNLATREIVDQVIQVRDDSRYPVRGVVMMGMGEPITTAGKTSVSLWR